MSDYPDVALRVTVREANGVPVPGLEPFDFEVNEDRVPEARPLIAVEPVINPDLPVSIVLLIDISGSMAGQPLNDAKEAAQALIDQLGEGEQIAVIAFAGAIDLDTIDTAREHPPTTDRSAAATLIDGLEALGGTPLYDALYKGTLWAQEATPGHRAIVLLTDGVDEDPGSVVASEETPIEEATRANVPVFTIGLGRLIDSGWLERVARRTGGTYQETPDSADLPELFLNVLDRLKQQYIVTYESGLPEDGEVHRVSVHVEVEDRQAQDEAEIGPVPLGEEPPAPEPSETATPVTPTVAPTHTPMPAPTRSSDLAGQEPTIWRWLIALIAVAAGLGLVAVAFIGFLAWRRKKRQSAKREQEHCLSCGRLLAPGEVCPDCGPDGGRFRKPD